MVRVLKEKKKKIVLIVGVVQTIIFLLSLFYFFLFSSFFLLSLSAKSSSFFFSCLFSFKTLNPNPNYHKNQDKGILEVQWEEKEINIIYSSSSFCHGMFFFLSKLQSCNISQRRPFYFLKKKASHSKTVWKKIFGASPFKKCGPLVDFFI